jgi:transposase InsO family protein
MTPFGRRLLVDRIEVLGWPVADAAQSMGVSRETAYKWLRRWRTEGEAGLVDRSSRPLRCSVRLTAAQEQVVMADRIREREGPHLMAGRLGMPRSTIYAVLKRRGLSRLRDLDRSTGIPIRYVKDCPGELVHIDIKQLGRVPAGGGWRSVGVENRGTKQKVGYEFCHSMVDDHSRVAYTEVLDSPTGEACAGFLLRAAQWFAGLGYRIDRVMTDNALAYTSSRAFADALHTIGAVHQRIRPWRPQTNGKVERFHQTLLAGWVYKRHYDTNQQRREALAEYIDQYNRSRPHSELAGQPPMTILVNHLCGKDT